MILIRAQKVDDNLERFASDLKTWSGMPVAFALDERRGEVESNNWPKVSITHQSCADLGLYCPDDFAWRCGDYGLYLARQQFPDEKFFWLIESDVRIGGSDPASFFRFFQDKPQALLAGYIERAPSDWHWYRSAVSRDNTVLTCFFPVCRLTADGIDALLDARRQHGKSWARRKFWPNDEAFVATGIAASGLPFADLNDFDQKFYDVTEYSFEALRDASAPIIHTAQARLFHPVLYGQELQDKAARLNHRARKKSRWHRLKVRLARSIGPLAWSTRKNQSEPWIGNG